ncbi:phosphatidylinositol-specific phospholipase C1-like protein [Hymenobacter sp. GOD-10R]|uniref:phosphatidylinositol-specific phospholipase C1-like protein n=1 Tax=Hymenobacter sp. GOD-10R TaxID=3093922 RepID=UPI002D77A4E4|nr:phosphatidylinositol-specific phospholipase C1-like protein [Hymenobacter sp. GOD-10R]WRQ26603.1 phosphatidylinositol-specific phospholipase C1-like protein [Hymenobacter sp. GOD-10R]
MKVISLSSLLLISSFLSPAKDDELPINKIQVIGSHNSYKQAIDPKLFRMLQKNDSVSMSKIDYSHLSLSEQLGMGLSALEIDVYADQQGGKYAHPKGLDLAPGQPAYDTEGVMKQPGFKVFHIQDIDFRSNCPTFKMCLQELKRFSAAHPDHPPVFITMNAKSEAMSRPGFTVPEPFTAAVFDQLDKEIIDNLGRENIITPDQVRGKYETLESAVLHQNWPTLKQARGKYIFILDEIGEKRATYIAGHPSLKGRVLFADAEPGTPEAAIHIMNNAKKDLAAIQALVQKGYIIRTRADSDTQEARKNDKSSFEAAMKSGAQIISTDFYQKSTHFKSDYVISFSDGKYFRPDPVFAKNTAGK